MDRFNFSIGKSVDDQGWKLELIPTLYFESSDGQYSVSCGWLLWGFRISYDKKMWELELPH